ncbi:hemagglutinin repeat-containing protein, partial [Acetobacteraceae bacterium B3987]|nr:hemagglutinin repeat-containing protein [Acetobacteraceae bacterium B3987]
MGSRTSVGYGKSRDANDGSISATAAQLAAKDISLDAKNNIDLEAGWNRQSALNHTTQKGLSVGVGFSLSASGQMQRTNMESHQATAVDTVLNATNSVS